MDWELRASVCVPLTTEMTSCFFLKATSHDEDLLLDVKTTVSIGHMYTQAHIKAYMYVSHL